MRSAHGWHPRYTRVGPATKVRRQLPMQHTRPYSGLGDPTRWTLIEVLAEQAQRRPDEIWIQSTDGPTLTFGDAWRDAERVAGHLATLGIQPGDRVIVMLPNGIDLVQAWLGIGRLGAIAVLLNTELRGRFLEHQIDNCGAALAIVDPTLLPTVIAALPEAPSLTRVLLTGAFTGGTPGLECLPFQAWRAARPSAGAPPRPQDPFCIMYTSGTSGPAKGVVMPHAHCTLFGVGTVKAFQLRPEDRYYIVLPLFHVNGLLMQLGGTLLAGIRAIVRPRFSATAWLDDVRGFGATVTNMLGTLSAFVIAQPPLETDRDHAIRALLNAPNPAEHEAVFRERFGIRDVISGFGMTEVNIPVWGRLGEARPGAAGWVHDEHFEILVADPETDEARAPGELGEILVRPRIPFGFMTEYFGMPQKTVEAWRNLWFHTGDAGTLGDDGLLTFVDRIKDCIRRRGENISATEVESAVATLRGIAEVAACAVPSGRVGGEDEILLSVVPIPGTELSLEAIAAHADAVLPRFARVRFLEFVAELPKTATGKVQRAQIRRRGAGEAWDRDVPTIAR
jgi:carnitine-CoA ligase